MNQRLTAPILSLCLLSGSLSAQAYAQGPGQTPRVATAQPVQQGAGVDDTVQREVSPEMDQILKTWETYSVKLQKLEGEFERYDYDFVFKTEKRSEGRYYYEAPDRGRMDFLPPKQLPETNETRGVVFQVKAAYTQSWICTGKEILDINHDEKTYNLVDIPERYQGNHIIESPLPFLFGMKAEEMKRRYLLAFGSMHNPAKGVIHIVASPLMEAQQREYRRVEVLLSTRDFLPTAVRLFGTTGNGETVYAFNKHNTRTLPWLQNPFQGRLPGSYQLLQHVKAEAPERNAQRIIPDGQLQQRTVQAPGQTELR